MTRQNGTPLAQWTLFNNPAVATQATVSQAGVASKRHVVIQISATFTTAATAQGTVVTLQLLDAGIVVWAKQAILPVSGIWEVNANVNIASLATGNTMTLNFAVAGVAGSFQSVCMSGYTIDER